MRVRPELDLVSAGVNSRPDVSQPFVVGFGCTHAGNRTVFYSALVSGACHGYK